MYRCNGTQESMATFSLLTATDQTFRTCDGGVAGTFIRSPETFGFPRLDADSLEAISAMVNGSLHALLQGAASEVALTKRKKRLGIGRLLLEVHPGFSCDESTIPRRSTLDAMHSSPSPSPMQNHFSTEKPTQKKFHRPHDAEELNRGEGMDVHPVSGEPLRFMIFDAREKHFIHLTSRGAWNDSPDETPLPPIVPADTSYGPGDPFPSHWEFDPYTGKPLSAKEAVLA